MFKVLFFCLIVKNENDERWQSLKSTYSKQKVNTNKRKEVKHLAKPKRNPKKKIQQLWAINEYQKTAYPSREKMKRENEPHKQSDERGEPRARKTERQPFGKAKFARAIKPSHRRSAGVKSNQTANTDVWPSVDNGVGKVGYRITLTDTNTPVSSQHRSRPRARAHAYAFR